MNALKLVRPVVIIAFFSVATVIPVNAQTPVSESAAAASVVRAYHEALVAGDAPAVLRLLAPDAVILESGDRETREEYRDHHLQEDILFSQAVPTHSSTAQVTVIGDVAWVSSTSVTQGTYQNRRVDLSGAELMVLSRTTVGWTIRAIHWSSHKSASAR